MKLRDKMLQVFFAFGVSLLLFVACQNDEKVSPTAHSEQVEVPEGEMCDFGSYWDLTDSFAAKSDNISFKEYLLGKSLGERLAIFQVMEKSGLLPMGAPAEQYMLKDEYLGDEINKIAIPQQSLKEAAMQNAQEFVSPGLTGELPSTIEFPEILAMEIPEPQENFQKIELGGELESDLYKGYPLELHSNWSERIVFAKILNALAVNYDHSVDTTKVTVEGKSYTRIGDFLWALQQDSGYTFQAHIEHRVANFIGFQAKTTDGYVPIALPMAVLALVDLPTGEESEEGPAMLPLPPTHSELVLKVSHPETGLDLEVAWFEGTGSIGFVPRGIHRTEDWAGTIVRKTYERFSHNIDESSEVASMAGMMAAALNKQIIEQQLPGLGYGLMGTCNDSVAMLQAAMQVQQSTDAAMRLNWFPTGFPFAAPMNNETFTQALPLLHSETASGRDDLDQRPQYEWGADFRQVDDQYLGYLQDAQDQVKATPAPITVLEFDQLLSSMPWTSIDEVPFRGLQCMLSQMQEVCIRAARIAPFRPYIENCELH